MKEKKFLGRGYSQDDKDDKAIYIGNLPGRKQVCLYTTDRGLLEVLSYFKTHELAQKALDWLDRLVICKTRGNDG